MPWSFLGPLCGWVNPTVRERTTGELWKIRRSFIFHFPHLSLLLISPTLSSSLRLSLSSRSCSPEFSPPSLLNKSGRKHQLIIRKKTLDESGIPRPQAFLSWDFFFHFKDFVLCERDFGSSDPMLIDQMSDQKEFWLKFNPPGKRKRERDREEFTH